MQQAPGKCDKEQEREVGSVPAYPALQSEAVLHFQLVHSGLHQRSRPVGMDRKYGRLGFLEVLGSQWQHTLQVRVRSYRRSPWNLEVKDTPATSKEPSNLPGLSKISMLCA